MWRDRLTANKLIAVLPLMEITTVPATKANLQACVHDQASSTVTPLPHLDPCLTLGGHGKTMSSIHKLAATVKGQKGFAIVGRHC